MLNSIEFFTHKGTSTKKFFVFVVCVFYFSNSFAQGGIEAIRQKAEAGDPSAMNTMGNIYLNGSAGQERNVSTAFRWFEKAAEANYPAAYFNIGLIYERGLMNGHSDLARAEAMYKKASSLGFAKADEGIARINSTRNFEVCISTSGTCNMSLAAEQSRGDKVVEYYTYDYLRCRHVVFMNGLLALDKNVGCVESENQFVVKFDGTCAMVFDAVYSDNKKKMTVEFSGHKGGCSADTVRAGQELKKLKDKSTVFFRTQSN
jgi:hypothetical protein